MLSPSDVEYVVQVILYKYTEKKSLYLYVACACIFYGIFYSILSTSPFSLSLSLSKAE